MKPVNKALLAAAESGDLEAVKKTLEDGAEINAQEKDLRQSALHIASSKGFLEIVELLVEKNADILLLDAVDMTPLHLAARDG